MKEVPIYRDIFTITNFLDNYGFDSTEFLRQYYNTVNTFEGE